uniref:Tyrosine N-monooxygenase n=1 Tax=Oryza rufipogon TaxID=4529 RepID=A0A0E0P5D8_ORYRU
MHKNNDTIMPSQLIAQNDHAYVLTFLMSIAMAILLLVALFYRIKKQAAAMAAKRKQQPKLPPGLATMQVVGNMHQMLMNKPVFRWIHRLLDEMDTEILCLRLGGVHMIAVASPEMAREVLRKNDAVLASRPSSFASRAFSFGYKNTIMSLAGDQWRKMRRVLASEILSPAMERRMLGRRVEEADHLVNYVYSNCNNGTVDVRHVTRYFCGNIIRKLVFGRRHFNSGDGNIGPGHEEEAHIDALFTALDYLGAFSVSDYFPALVVNGLMDTFNRLHDPIIMERMEEWKSLRTKGDKRREVADFLDVLISLEDAQGEPLLSLDEIKAETLEIILATVDNPSNAVEWALAKMVNNPKAMKKAVDELDMVVGRERLVEESDIHNLTYLKACIREAFRLHPYHPFNPPHVAIADTTVAGYMIPKGSHVMLSRIGLGQNPRAWDKPLEFRPERHLKSAGTVVLAEPELRFVSFSAGRRGCPAVSLGTSITMMLFARLLQGFSWSIPPGGDRIELQESATSLQLSKPLFMQAKPRLLLHLYEADILN